VRAVLCKLILVAPGRGWTHLHCLLWALLPSHFLQEATRHPELRAALGKFIDASVQACLTPGAHVESLLANLFAFDKYRAPWHVGKLSQPLPDVKENESRFLSHVEHAILRVQEHTRHGSRCCKGETGECRCSQAFPRELCECTAPHCIDAGYAAHELDPRGTLSAPLDETVVIEPRRPEIDAAAHLEAVRDLVAGVAEALPSIVEAEGACLLACKHHFCCSRFSRKFL
jgi:hypothetical protein